MRARDAVRALALAGALLPAAAHAGDPPAYLFGLDERAILDTMDHYRGRDGYDARRVLAELSPPFDCRRLGDACAELGPEGAYALLAATWREALARVPGQRLHEDMIALFDDFADRYLETHFPDGLSPRDPYLAGEPGDEVPCPKSTFQESGTGFAIRQKSGTVNLAVLVGGFSKITFFKQKPNGQWDPTRTDTLTEKGSIFVTGTVGPQENVLEKTERNSKRTNVHFYGGGVPGALGNPYAEGCGSSTGLAFLSACTCSGEKPVEYGGTNE